MWNVKLTVLASAIFALTSGTAQAIDTRYVNDAKGTPFLRLDFYSPADDSSIPWGLSESDKQLVLSGVDYWARLLTITPGKSPAVIDVITNANTPAVAYAGSNLASNLPFGPTFVQAVLQNQGPPMPFSHGYFGIGTSTFENAPYIPSIVPLNNAGISLPGVIVHEVAHALGVLNLVQNRDAAGGSSHTLYYPSNLSLFAAGLRDDNDQPVMPGQDVWCTGCNNLQSGAGVFDVRKDKGYFTGTHVRAVLGDAMKGIPVSMFFEDGSIDDNYMSHFELKNSLMSHQQYRNYTMMMEAELAVIQDLGYNIDRRNFYGASVYGNQQTFVNTKGFFQRNAEGTAYLPNTYNQSMQGLGLHVYGSNNTVFQQADLLSAGAGGGGIRVDGRGNTITILPGTRVHANGAYGRGVMFTYGRDHNLVQRGEVMATGDQGIAVAFDFGRDVAGDRDQRGSYIHTVYGAQAPILDEINGPLVQQFDLTGRVVGRRAAVFISDNAYVGTINVMQGAQIVGDIVSEYKETDGAGKQRITALQFGMAGDNNGVATAQADQAFNLQYNGHITGINNLALLAKGGVTELNGTHALYSADIAQGATLGGNSNYTLHSAGGFTNAGTLKTGTKQPTTIIGNYTQTASGALQVGVSGNNTVNNLFVNGNAAIDGTLAIAPQRSWFASGSQFTGNKWITATNLSGTFANVTTVLASPTLTATATDLGNNNVRLVVNRRANAYSQHANSPSGQQIGQALDAAAGAGGANMQSLFAALDFSAADGSQVRSAFAQLSPGAYAEMFHGSLLRERTISQLVSSTGQDAGNDLAGWHTFAIPFGGYYRHRAATDAVGSNGNTYGVVFGGEAAADAANALTLGVHGAVTTQSTRVGGEFAASGKSTALDLGAHMRFARNPHQGAHAYAQARLGVDDASFDRTVNVNGFATTATGKWTGVAGTAGVGGGWRFQTAEMSSIGPVAGLDYTLLQRPDVMESGGAGVNLNLDKKTFHSVRSHLGVQWQSAVQTASGNVLSTRLLAAWQHELRDTAINQTASFAGAPVNRFGSHNTVVGKDSAMLQASLAYQLKRTMQLKAGLSTTMWKGGDASYAGSVSLNWQF